MALTGDYVSKVTATCKYKSSNVEATRRKQHVYLESGIWVLVDPPTLAASREPLGQKSHITPLGFVPRFTNPQVKGLVHIQSNNPLEGKVGFPPVCFVQPGEVAHSLGMRPSPRARERRGQDPDRPRLTSACTPAGCKMYVRLTVSLVSARQRLCYVGKELPWKFYLLSCSC